jgi:ribosomal protein L18
MESLGLSEGINNGFSSGEATLRANQQIRETNRLSKVRFQDDVSKGQQKVASFSTPKQEDVASAVASQVASKGKDIEVAATSAISLASKDADLVKSVGSTLKSGAAVGETIAERAGSVGRLGLGASGLGVAMGIKDTVDDLIGHRIEGKNAAERFSNVAGIASGALEGLGTALDLTGVGAGLGVGLQALGGLTSLAGSVADIAGEDEEKKKAAGSLQTLQNKGPTQLQEGSIKVGEGGVVREN